jgi:HK97 family phage portal protein
MSRRSDREERIAQKAADVTAVNVIEALVGGGGPVSYTPSGTLSYFQIFGTSYARIYRTQSAFRSVVDFLSRNIGSVHMKLTEEINGVQIPRPEHESIQIINHPQPGVPYSRLMRQIVGDKAIYDTAALWKLRENFDPTPNSKGRVLNSGRVRHLVRIPVPFISLSQASMTSPLMFELRAGKTVNIPADDVIWMPGYSPESNVAGVPPVETLRQLLAEEWAAAKDRENNWKQGPQEHVVFIQESGTPGLDPSGAKEFKTSWRNKYGGVNASNSHEWPLLPPGITPKSIAFDAASQEYLATRQLTREECCRAFGIDPSLLGVRQANFASLDMYHQMLYQDTLSPWCVSIQEEFEEQYLTEWDDTGDAYALDFNMTAKLQGSFAEQAKIGQQAVGGPWMTIDEFRQKFMGLQPLPDGEGAKIITPLNVVRGGGPEANPQDSENQFKREIDGVLRIASGGEQP